MAATRSTPDKAPPKSASMRPPLQQRSERTLRNMVQAGRTLAEARGNLDDISLNDVVGAAQTSIGAFYGRFKDKETFLAYLLDVALGEGDAMAEASIAGDPVWLAGPADAIVQCIVRIYVSQFRQNRGLFKAFLRHYSAVDGDNPMRQANRRMQDRVVPLLARQLPGTPAAARFQARAAIQFLVGTLAHLLLSDPGPLRLASRKLDTELARMMGRYLQLP